MHLRRILLCVAGFTALTVACSSAAAPDPVFDAGGGRTVTCMVHQPTAPGSRYTDPRRRDTVQVLTLLHYYTVNGAKPYCDGRPASAVDRRWAQLYLDLGADPAAVHRILPRS